MISDTILVTGACGQLGTEIVAELRQQLGTDRVIATDVLQPQAEALLTGPFHHLDTTDTAAILSLLKQYNVTQIYHLAAILSAKGEQEPNLAWNVNINGYMAVLDAAKFYGGIRKLYFPSSIAVFGENTPKDNTPQHTVTDASTVYGISKYVGERLCHYYHHHYGLDIRSLRYPGIISHKTLPGGGTTDYAVHIYHEAVLNGHYNCFLTADTYLPMMYMPDALRATFQLMDAPADRIKERGSYNLGAMSFCPADVAASIQQHIPDFSISYVPDSRQAIADSWPRSINHEAATLDWGWQPQYDLAAMTADMLHHVRERYAIAV